jgi:hypothetical protein
LRDHLQLKKVCHEFLFRGLVDPEWVGQQDAELLLEVLADLQLDFKGLSVVLEDPLHQ